MVGVKRDSDGRFFIGVQFTDSEGPEGQFEESMVELSPAVGKRPSGSRKKNFLSTTPSQSTKSKRVASTNLKRELKRTAAVYGQCFILVEIKNSGD